MIPEVYYREKQVLATFAPVSRSTWWRWVKAGRAPPPISLGHHITVWRGSELERWRRGEWKATTVKPKETGNLT